MSNTSTLRLACQIELNKRSVIPRCDSACTFSFRRGGPSACALHGLCAMSSNMMNMIWACCVHALTAPSCPPCGQVRLNKVCACCSHSLTAQGCPPRRESLRYRLLGGARKIRISIKGAVRRKHKQSKPRRPVSSNMSDGSTNKLNRESQFLATTPLIEIRTF